MDEPLSHRASARVEDAWAKALRDAHCEEASAFTSTIAALLDREPHILKSFFNRYGHPIETVALHSRLLDACLTAVVQRFLRGLGEQLRFERWSLMAVGSFGRGDCSPYEHHEIVFLVDDQQVKRHESFTRAFFDLFHPIAQKTGLRLHCFSGSQETLLAKYRRRGVVTSPLDSCRFICGSEALFRQFQKRIRTRLSTSLPDVLKNLEAFRQKRDLAYGGTVRVCEPNLRWGTGGLSDLYANWILAAGHRNFGDFLKKRGPTRFVSREEWADLHAAYAYLLGLRLALHFHYSCRKDIFDIVSQEALSRYSLGELHHHSLRVESYLHALENTLLLHLRDQKQSWLKRLFRKAALPARHGIDGFRLRSQLIEAEHPDVFKEDPLRLIRVFRHAQQYKVSLSKELREQVRDSLELLTPELAASENAARSFRSILQSPGQVYSTLLVMCEIGVLAILYPEFYGLKRLAPAPPYNAFLSAMYVLRCLSELDKVFLTDDPIRSRYRRSIHKTIRPTLLYLMMLMRGVLLAEVPEKRAALLEEHLEAIGISENQKEIIRLVLTFSEAMPLIEHQQDIASETVIADFARRIRTPENLRYLHVLTFCVASARKPDIWNAHKESLHNTFFERVLAHMHSEGFEQKLTLRLARKKAHLASLMRARMPQLTRDEVRERIDLYPMPYFRTNTFQEMELHEAMIERLKNKIKARGNPLNWLPEVDWEDDLEQSLTRVNVVDDHRKDLFAHLTGSFAAAGMNILSIKAVTRDDGVGIFSFCLANMLVGTEEGEDVKNRFYFYLEHAIRKENPIQGAIAKQVHRQAQVRSARLSGQFSQPILPSVNIEYEVSSMHMRVEIRCMDRIGLLYDVARAVAQSGYKIDFVLVTTEHSQALDTMTVSPDEDTKTLGLMALRNNLARVVHS